MVKSSGIPEEESKSLSLPDPSSFSSGFKEAESAPIRKSKSKRGYMASSRAKEELISPKIQVENVTFQPDIQTNKQEDNSSIKKAD